MEHSYSYLSTDLYQLTMAEGYLRAGLQDATATFDLFVRKLPGDWKYLIVCGIEEALNVLADFHFTDTDRSYLHSLGFSDDFCRYLRNFRFRCNVKAVAEGTPVLADEPIMEVTGNLIEAQLAETLLLSLINYQTLIATKAHRIVQAAAPAAVVDFGLRRAPGPEAGLRASRAAYLAGMTATSNVEAGLRYGIPVVGTHAHAFVQAFPSEYDAFKAWCSGQNHPLSLRSYLLQAEPTTLLIDTYDVGKGALNACRVIAEGAKVAAVRIDSGDLAGNARMVRGILDSHGQKTVKIIATNDLNEAKITALKEAKAPIDSYGVGTDMVTARPEAALGGVYKLVELNGKPRIKLSAGKQSWPGQKQLYRSWADGDHDLLATATEKGEGRQLLDTVMEWGSLIPTYNPLQALRARATRELIPVTCEVSNGLKALLADCKRELNLVS